MELAGDSPELVGYSLSQGESSYYIGARRERCVPRTSLFICEAALCSSVCDKPLLMMMKEDRLPRQLPEIDAAMSDELAKVQHLTDATWAFFAAFVEMDTFELRDACCKGSLTAAGCIGMHLRHARRGVWALLQGDRKANALDFSAGPKAASENQTLFEIWTLLQLREIDLALDGLELISREYGSATLQSRSQLVQL
jgi:hypothetical protein